ncbi:MAG: hypothetical protein IKR46_00665 [Clostridia bacterium]|nr:hypothetical protein [Clostridia bacterium]
MTNYRKILELHYLGHSQRNIEASVRSSHQTVKSVIERANELHISWPLDDDVTNEVLDELFYGERTKLTSLYAVINYDYIHKELSKKGVTLTLLWQKYCERAYINGETPYMSTQFGEKYRRWARITKATMRVTHKLGCFSYWRNKRRRCLLRPLDKHGNGCGFQNIKPQQAQLFEKRLVL